jgi:hypothetical protein
MKQLIISAELANAILNYLGGQPYKDVAAMISALMQLKEVPAPIERKTEAPNG